MTTIPVSPNSTTTPARTPALDMRGISKTFPGVKALDNVQLQAWTGEIHSLMGENGAGKSTLMKILSGAYTADSGGEIRIDGQLTPITGPKAARAAGIAIIYQELSLAPNLTVAENIYLGNEPKQFGVLADRATMRRETVKVLERLGAEFGPDTVVNTLSIAEQQQVEIARALHQHSHILIMDEPTTALSTRETDRLFELIKRLRDEGIAILYISHRMAEIYELSDRVSVLRDGTYVGTLDRAELSAERLVQMMVGRPLSNLFDKHSHATDQVVLEVKNLTDGGRRVKAVQLVAPRRRSAGAGRSGRRGPQRTGAADFRRRPQRWRRHLAGRETPVSPQSAGRDQQRHRLPDRRSQGTGPVSRHERAREHHYQRVGPRCAGRWPAQSSRYGTADRRLHPGSAGTGGWAPSSRRARCPAATSRNC
jgi:ABC-type sugar transport system ATPase subunit